MPVPKNKEKKYGMIVGHLQNLGYSLDESKKKTDEALNLSPKKSKKSEKEKKLHHRKKF